MKKKFRNVFNCYTTIGLSSDQLEEIRKYLNNEHTGSERVPIDAVVSESLKNAHYRVNASHELKCTIEIDSTGHFNLKSVELDGIIYAFDRKGD